MNPSVESQSGCYSHLSGQGLSVTLGPLKQPLRHGSGQAVISNMCLAVSECALVCAGVRRCLEEVMRVEQTLWQLGKDPAPSQLQLQGQGGGGVLATGLCPLYIVAQTHTPSYFCVLPPTEAGGGERK